MPLFEIIIILGLLIVFVIACGFVYILTKEYNGCTGNCNQGRRPCDCRR